ncbi:response regulator transcription factor [Paenalkalicoccus suaedae]|uniref:Response regulator transcription factor n=1 Tax=Paenalkalicoccus suaedae TaxID=2592382 RepID=A0A859FG57_9BACI|nr:LuxR C-terminal-related transcriptional regulator [Paenalkalicoccus suaedae]QKS72353.1 response regulator transcription factor [Paenalkalicoccus suaedae]
MQLLDTANNIATNDKILIIDHDKYLSTQAEKRLAERMQGHDLTIDKGGSKSLDEEAGYIFLFVEHSSLEAVEWIESMLKQKKDGTSLLVMTVGKPRAALINLLHQGLDGLLSLHSLLTRGDRIVEQLTRYGVYLEQSMHKDLVKQLHESKMRDRPIKKLTLRVEDVKLILTKNEIFVLQHILDGHNNRKIAELMFLAPSTISTIISHLLKKLGANDRTDAMVTIIKKGWVDATR